MVSAQFAMLSWQRPFRTSGPGRTEMERAQLGSAGHGWSRNDEGGRR